MNFGEILYTLRKKNGLTQADISNEIGVKKNTISNYENNISKPQYEQLIKLCNLLKCDPNTLMESDIKYTSSELTIKNQQIISAYHNLNNPDKQKIVDFILGIGEYDIKSNAIKAHNKVIYKFPVYEQQAAAGAGITGRDGKFSMRNLFTTDIPQNAVFGVHIKGESMINTDTTLKIEDVPDNSIVLLNPKVSDSDLNKTIVVASINNDVICKYFLIEQDGVQFYSLNREKHASDDRFAKSPSDYRIIGQVVKIIKPMEYE